MSDESDLQAAVDQFLVSTDDALTEYDQGYADADATLRVIRTHLDELRDTAGE